MNFHESFQGEFKVTVDGADCLGASRQAAEGGRPGGVTAEELTRKSGEGKGYAWSQTPEDVEVRRDSGGATPTSSIRPNSTRCRPHALAARSKALWDLPLWRPSLQRSSSDPRHRVPRLDSRP